MNTIYGGPARVRLRVTILALVGTTVCAGWQAGSQDQPQAPASPQSAVEVTTRDEAASFTVKVNLVQVPVVVRDSKGQTVANLTREDFQLLDQGKPQVISRFTVEKRGAKAEEIKPETKVLELPGEQKPLRAPDRFVAYLFDDLHLEFGDLVRTREAGERHMANSLGPGDRAAIFTTSGLGNQDFTDSLAELREALKRLMPRGTAGKDKNACPYVPYYMADWVINKEGASPFPGQFDINDQSLLAALTREVLQCMSLPLDRLEEARLQAVVAARQALIDHGRETQIALSVLRDVVRRTSAMPGLRSIILVSPGFLTLDDHRHEVPELLDRALQARVVVDTLDARGVYNADPSTDASRTFYNAESARIKSQYERDGASHQADLLAELADGTGGVFVQGTNDYDLAFKRAASPPEYVYMLAFAPQNLKLDGKFHSIRVKLKQAGKFTVQVRRGYFAPTRLEDAAEQAKREIEEALFSREEIRDIPLELHTQFYKTGDYDAKLAVLARVNVDSLQFRKLDGRNRNDLTVVAVLFDRNGNYVSGRKKTVIMRLRDETLADKRRNKITVRASFDVKTGDYAIRLVVRDMEGQLMAAENGSVEIP